ncbi:class I adenylate-forming enzyme family protein [Nocardioides sp. YIM 152315]|uniref:class I adenylate-forming enzyme family protein n=1 Tax=Nocardioides sp. YIM 152315 TaxID=3031760 RepID=UPI0023D9FCF0|nr:class I adenylate-forming enzyme family protein [Nocardioides sp. YIM 152315]MDF1604125.1 class I adenylate-forming enzyme family protein [Nocardioides sp. YIM 152315]
MTAQTDPRLAAQRIVADLTAPGAAFELVRESVLGAPTTLFAHRRRALHQLLAESVEHGDRTYIATLEERISFAEHAAMVSSLAHALREQHGVRPGDRVALAAANTPEWIVAFWAATSIGAVAVGFNAWWSARELSYGLEHARPVVVVADDKRRALLEEVGVDVPVLGLDEVRRLAVAHPGAALPSAEVAEDDPAVILYTSGTSGRPKGAVHSHRNLLSVVEFHRMSDALLAAFGDPTDPRERTYLLVMPLFHIGSLHNLAVPRLATGSKVALHLGSFRVDPIMRLVERERVTNWGAVPTMATRLLDADLSTYDTSSLTAFALASAPSSPQLKEKLRTRLPFASSLVDSYGLTESCTGVAVATPMDLAEAPGTLGRPIIGVELEVRDPDGRPLPAGVEGEICVRSAYNMLGYWEDELATTAAIRADRWLHTGDLGTLDDQGRISLSSRRSDLIIRGGENVYPAEVEGVLADHPEVAECIVLGVDHTDLGQEVGAVVVPATGAQLDTLEERLREHAASGLAYFKVPTHWRFASTPLPRNATGKVIRREIEP